MSDFRAGMPQRPEGLRYGPPPEPSPRSAEQEEAWRTFLRAVAAFEKASPGFEVTFEVRPQGWDYEAERLTYNAQAEPRPARAEDIRFSAARQPS